MDARTHRTRRRATDEALAARTTGKFDHPALLFALVESEARLIAFALTNRLSASSASEREGIAPRGNSTAYIELLAADPNSAGLGLGRALLRDAVGASDIAGCSDVMLHVRIDNLAAIHLYETEGSTTLGAPRAHPLPGAPTIAMRRQIHRDL
jgi:ribosomal protein S18 acetylase RimI-like enzyme